MILQIVADFGIDSFLLTSHLNLLTLLVLLVSVICLSLNPIEFTSFLTLILSRKLVLTRTPVGTLDMHSMRLLRAFTRALLIGVVHKLACFVLHHGPLLIFSNGHW